ncbi:PH domain-containing protein [Prevotella aurantiaca]|jgi:hypothetical protein|uniref:PH domain-containing protein n=1 Tax=Prevotella aurantiaca TaxID=596085 RepID=A0A930HL95_9BACT|nr:PH domain-containing protein [Prevotella aurantiaca]MBF1383791.1 PH domain-containing protein [Prevotella aurantiaca]
MNRTFNHRIMILEGCAIVLFIMGTLYGFWHRDNVALVVLGTLFLILSTIALDRALHSSYTIANGKLILKQGRIAKSKCIDIAEIASTRELPLAFHLGSYVLIELKNGKVLSIQPDNSKAFIATIQKLL